MRLYLIFFFITTTLCAQNLQYNYDLRHTTDPEHNIADFHSLSFNSVSSSDIGSLFLKMETDFTAINHNMGKVYMQFMYTLNLKILHVSPFIDFSGGMGFIQESNLGYPIVNTGTFGVSYSFSMLGGWASYSLGYRYCNFELPSQDVLYSLWWGRDMFERLKMDVSISVWSMNRNQGNAWTAGEKGKTISGCAEPTLLFKLDKGLAIGTKIRMYYNLYSYAKNIVMYPTLAVNYEF